jgi:GMP synthase-like glutamine amidotransferase
MTYVQELHQMHRDAILEAPDGFTNLGHSQLCDFQGLYVPRKILSIQGHPEFNTFIMSTLLEVRYEQGIFDDALYTSGAAR